MLSILIPIYNYNATKLVKELHQQADNLGIIYEILLLDDASDNTELCNQNRSLKELPFVTLLELPTTAGRAVARNYLAGQAQYPYLLFLDCDSEPVDENYLQRYMPYCNGNKKNIVVCGGVAYKKQKPPHNAYLRWVYGIKCEVKNAAQRSKNANMNFSAFNLLIEKELFWSIRFNEMLKNYGHEDTLFGLELQKMNYQVIHIDNPLFHTGIDNNDVYIDKTEKGVENLQILLEKYPDHEQLIKYIRLLKYYNFFKNLHLIWFIRLNFRITRSFLLSNLKSKHPSMILFNLYKLGYLCNLYRQTFDL